MPSLLETIQNDSLALAVGHALALADREALSRGVALADMLVSVAEDAPPPTRVWRVHYGPRDYVNRRGGDLTVFVDEPTGEVRRVLRGQ